MEGDKLVFTGFAIASGKTAFNRIGSSASEVSVANNSLAVLGDKIITVIKNYLQFFCKPTYNNFKFNDLIQNYGEKKAELYYKDHYQGGISNDDEDNGFEESSSDESSNKENELELNNNNNGEIKSAVGP